MTKRRNNRLQPFNDINELRLFQVTSILYFVFYDNYTILLMINKCTKLYHVYIFTLFVKDCLSNYLSSPLSSLRIRLPTYYLGWTGCSPTAFVSYFTAESNKDCIQDKWFLEPFSSSEPNMYMIYNFGHTAAWEVSPSGQIILNTATCTPQQIFTFVDYNSTDCFILNAQTLNIVVTVTRSTLPSGSTTAVCNDTIHLQNKTNKYQPFRIEVASICLLFLL